MYAFLSAQKQIILRVSRSQMHPLFKADVNQVIASTLVKPRSMDYDIGQNWSEEMRKLLTIP